MARRAPTCPEAREFEPDAVAVAHGEPPAQARLGVYVILAALAFGTAWSWLAQLDRVVGARGMLVAQSGPVVVQPLETSIIRSIRVRPGDVVKKGDVLAELDPTFASADLGQMLERKRFLAAWTARLDAELAERPQAGPAPDATPDEAAQTELFLRRREEYLARLDAQDLEIAAIEKSQQANEAEHARLNQQFALAAEVEAMYRQLWNKANTSRLEYLAALREKLRVEDLYAKTQERRELLAERLSQARAQRLAFVTGWRSDTASKLLEARRQLAEVEHALSKASRLSELVALTAVTDAVVKDVAQVSEGGVARQAETLVTLVPLGALDGELEAEVAIPASDIGHIRVGNAARLKLAAFPFQRHGFADAVVRMVSPDAFLPGQGAGGAPDAGGVFYKARLRITRVELKDVPQDFRLLPGMTLEAEILVGKRRVATYLLDPLVRALHESLSEP